MNKREIELAIRDEVAEWPGVSVEFEHGGKHPQAKLMFGDLMLRRAFGGNQDRTPFPHKTLADMRRVMIQLGAKRAAPEPSKEETERRYHKPNVEGVAKRPDPVARERAPVEPSIADQLVEAGVATPDQREEAKAADPPRTLFERMADAQRQGREGDPGRDDELPADQAEADEAERRRQEIEAAAKAIVDGVYFDLPEEIYHRVEALGGGAICDIMVSPGTFWAGSWLDPDRPPPDEDATKAQLIGRAYHVARLEPHRFALAYARHPAKADYPQCKIWNSTQVGEALAGLGETKKRAGESGADQAERLEDCGFDGPIWPLIKARFLAEIAQRDPRPIPLEAQVWDEIERDAHRLRAVPEIAELLDSGASEVSAFWTDAQGIRCKARFDKLAPDHWADLKTYQNSNRKALAQAIADAIRYNRYYIVACHYREAAEAIRAGGLQIVGEARDRERALIAAIQMKPSELACWFVFQEKGGVPNLLAKRFRFRAVDITREHEIKALMADGTEAERQMARQVLEAPTQIARKGQYEIERAKAIFAHYRQVYPPGEPWAPIDPIGEIGDLDFNQHWLEGAQ
jgi:hypothetical protein